MLAPGGRVVLMDFGLVVPHADRAGQRLVAGSVPYMAPEALTGDVGTARLHSWTSMRWAFSPTSCSPGGPPFCEAQPVENYTAKVRGPTPTVSSLRSDVPEGLSDLVRA